MVVHIMGRIAIILDSLSSIQNLFSKHPFGDFERAAKVPLLSSFTCKQSNHIWFIVQLFYKHRSQRLIVNNDICYPYL